ncbi:unnamed protein product [Zymoseptoria tritici ST99CH_3D1]|nr:unnamed protein product [Zymoseptoria tritici ST99CH_3D1]
MDSNKEALPSYSPPATEVTESIPTAPPPKYSPLKTFALTNTGTFTTRHLVLSQNGKPFLWVNTSSGFLGPPQINIHTKSVNGPIVVATRLRVTSSGCRVKLGNPDAVGKWHDVESQSFGSSQYGFSWQGKNYAWKRTHRTELGASDWRNGDYKLIDKSCSERVLAVYITNRSWFNSTDIARVEFMMELGLEVELIAFAGMLGIAEHIRRAK